MYNLFCLPFGSLGGVHRFIENMGHAWRYEGQLWNQAITGQMWLSLEPLVGSTLTRMVVMGTP